MQNQACRIPQDGNTSGRLAIEFGTGNFKPARPLYDQRSMDKFRGILMLAVGAFALFRGFVMYGRPNAWLAILLGLAAVGLGVFRLTRKTSQRLR